MISAEFQKKHDDIKALINEPKYLQGMLFVMLSLSVSDLLIVQAKSPEEKALAQELDTYFKDTIKAEAVS